MFKASAIQKDRMILSRHERGHLVHDARVRTDGDIFSPLTNMCQNISGTAQLPCL